MERQSRTRIPCMQDSSPCVHGTVADPEDPGRESGMAERRVPCAGSGKGKTRTRHAWDSSPSLRGARFAPPHEIPRVRENIVHMTRIPFAVLPTISQHGIRP